MGKHVIDATTGTFLDLEGSSRSEKVVMLRKNTQWRNPSVLQLLIENFRHWKKDGLHSLQYSIVATTSLQNTTKATKVTTDIGLNGNNHWTDALAPIDATGNAWFSWYTWATDFVLSYC